MIKKLIILFSTFLLISCNACSYSSMNGFGKTIKGSGNIINESRVLSDFHAVNIIGSMDVNILSLFPNICCFSIIVRTNVTVSPYVILTSWFWIRKSTWAWNLLLWIISSESRYCIKHPRINFKPIFLAIPGPQFLFNLTKLHGWVNFDKTIFFKFFGLY